MAGVAEQMHTRTHTTVVQSGVSCKVKQKKKTHNNLKTKLPKAFVEKADLRHFSVERRKKNLKKTAEARRSETLLTSYKRQQLLRFLHFYSLAAVVVADLR